MDNWIEVSKKLPKIDEYVLVYNTEGATLIGKFLRNGWIAIFSDGEKLMGNLTAIYWQNLPEPPSKWISVKERLPHREGYYDVLFDTLLTDEQTISKYETKM